MYLDDLLNIHQPYFEPIISQIYPTKLKLNKANYFDTEAPSWTWTLNCTIHEMITILIYLISHFLMEMCRTFVPMVYTEPKL